MAGCFDEFLQSSTDRDICIRIAEIGDVHYSPIDKTLVNHFPNLNRLRLTTKASEAKLSGVTNFWQKYYGRMNEEQKLGFNKRAKHLFSWNAPIESTQLGKKSNLSKKKYLFSKLQDKKSVRKVFETFSKRYANRKGGYSRVLKAGFRTGDDAPMAVIELVDRDPNARKVDKPKKVEPTKKDKETLPKTATK